MLSTGLRLTFATPGSYLKIPEIAVPEAAGISVITPALDSEPNAAGWHTAAVSVALQHDGSAGVVVQHRIDGGEWADGTGSRSPATAPTSSTTAPCFDDVEQVGVSGSLTVRIDTTAPVTGRMSRIPRR